MEDYELMLRKLKRVVILVVCLAVFMGTVFISLPFRNHRITEAEAVSVTAEYCGYYVDTNLRHTNIQKIDLEFADRDDLTVDGCCVKMEWVSKLDSLPECTAMHLLIHPRSGNVLQIEADGEVLLSFQDAQRTIRREALAFAAMGLLIYACTGVFLAATLLRKRKQKISKKGIDIFG